MSSLEFSKAKDAELAWINGLIETQDYRTDVNPVEEEEDQDAQKGIDVLYCYYMSNLVR